MATYDARVHEWFAEMLKGGHPNSLGRTEEVVGIVLADHARLGEFFDTMADPDDLVRLRVGDALEKVSDDQARRVTELLRRNLTSSTDWIVLNVTMDVLTEWAHHDPSLTGWLGPELERLCWDHRKSVAKRATKRRAELAE